MNRAVTLPVPWAAALLFVLAGCSGDSNPDECECPECRDPCPDGECHECCTDEHCAQGEVCKGEDYVCELACLQQDEDCAYDRDGCCDGLACDVFTSTCVEVCVADGDCPASHPDVAFNEDLLCKDEGLCDFQHCSDHGNCQPGTLCHVGDCVTPPGSCCMDFCKVAPAFAVVRQGTRAFLSATAIMTSGAMAPGVTFHWVSDDEAVATVADGVVSGGEETGAAVVTATVTGCPETTCDAEVLNYGAVTTGTRVVAIDELTGRPIEGVAVEIEGAAAALTDALGVALFEAVDLAAAPATVTLSRADYGYVSFAAAGSNDLIAHLREVPDPTLAGGYQGRFDFSKIICDPGDGCIAWLALTGASIPGNLFDLDLDALFGDKILTHIELGDGVGLGSGVAVGWAGGDGGGDGGWAGGAARGGLWGIAAVLLGLVVRRAFSKD